jgi:hypothetical protein
MPILIQEIVITAVVEPNERPVQANGDQAGRDELIEACVAESLRIQRQKQER